MFVWWSLFSFVIGLYVSLTTYLIWTGLVAPPLIFLAAVCVFTWLLATIQINHNLRLTVKEEE